MQESRLTPPWFGNKFLSGMQEIVFLSADMKL